MIVVSNTSPLTNLAAIGQFNLLQALFGEIHISTAVVSELSAGGNNWPGATEAKNATWVQVKPVSNQPLVDALRLDLDWGESEAIALALELKADGDGLGQPLSCGEVAGRRAGIPYGASQNHGC